MPNEFVARNGIIALNNSIITGSLNVTQGVTASLQGTASFATTASNVLGGVANYLPLFNTATSLSSSAIYQSSGNVGIGTTSPTASLHVYRKTTGTTTADRTTPLDILVLESENTADQEYEGFGQSLVFRGSTYNDSTQRTLGKIIHQINDNSVNTTRGTSLNIQLSTGSVSNTLASRLYIDYNGNVGVGTTSPYNYSTWNFATLNGNGGSGIVFRNNNVDTTQLYGFSGGTDLLSTGYFQLYTGGSVRMYIGTTGNMGIGTTSPGVKLDISSSAQHAMRIGGGDANGLFTTYFNGTISTLFFGYGPTLTTGATLNDGIIRYNGSYNLIFSRDGTEAARFNSSGNLGIGTTTPNAKLDVNGNALITGSLTVTGAITAQTLVVQTITSSVDFVTGSTRFGTLLSNTHAFTGSVGMTGSLTVVGAGITGSLFGTSSWATNAVSATSAISATTAGTVTGTSGQLLTKDDRIIEPNSITSGYMQFGFTSWDNNNGSPYADYLHMRSYTDSSGGSDNLVAFRKNAIGMRIWQQTWNSSTAYSSYRDVALVSGSTDNYIPIWTGTTQLINSAIYQSGGSIGIGTTSPGATLEARTTAAVNQQLVLSNGGTYHTGLIGTSTTTPVSDNNAWGLFGGPNDYLTRIANSLMLIGGSGVPGIGFRFTTSNLNTTGGTTAMYISASGNVGIGTTSPAGKLHVNQGNLLISNTYGLYLNDNDNNWKLYRSSSADYVRSLATGSTININAHFGTGEGFTIGANGSNSYYEILGSGPTHFFRGDVGIGATSPSARLHISASTGGVLEVDGAGTAGANALYVSASGNVGIGTASPTEKITIQSGVSTAAAISFRGNNLTSADELFIGQGTAGGTFIYNRGVYDMSFGTSNATRMFISSSGNVGIGTTTPAYKLHVVGGDVKLPNNYKLYFGDVAEALGFSIGSDGASNNMLITNNNNATLRIGTGGTSGHITFTPNSAESVRFTGTGDVGIGTTTPAAKLHVIGEIRAADATSVWKVVNSSAIAFNGTTTSHPLAFITADTERARITATGDFGIGTTSPTTKLQVNGSTLITGSLTVGQTTTGSSENTLTVGLPLGGGTGEGGQVLLVASGGLYTSASMIDNYQNTLRLLRGTNAGSDAVLLNVNLHNGQVAFNKYTGSGAFSGTAAANLAVDSSGNVITVAAGGGGSVTINNNTDNYLITATGTANTLNGEANLQFNGTTLTVTGSAIVTGSLALTGSFNITNPTLVGNVQYTQGYTASLSGSISVISSISTGSYRSAFYNYVATQGANARAGTVAAVWYLTTCSFAEYITTDIGTTANLDITARISGSNVQLVALGSGSWAINTSVNLV